MPIPHFYPAVGVLGLEVDLKSGTRGPKMVNGSEAKKVLCVAINVNALFFLTSGLCGLWAIVWEKRRWYILYKIILIVY